MEQSKTAFFERYDLLMWSIKNLRVREKEIHLRMTEIQKQLNKGDLSNEINAELLLTKKPISLAGGLENELKNLQKELVDVEEKIRAIPSNGGNSGVLKTDIRLTELAEPLVKDLKKQAKEDLKKRQDLEQRYSKVIDEIIKLNQERNEYGNYCSEMTKIFELISENTNLSWETDKQKLYEVYKFPVPQTYLYQYLGQLPPLIEEYKKSGLM